MKRYLVRAAPPALLVAFYWAGLWTWFYQDDFGWLAVRLGIHGWADVLPALLGPKAHGNMRPLSETGFFTLFSALFGLDPLPFRIWVFLTQAAALVLLGAVVRRLTRSEAAGLAAQVLWAANCGLAAVMCWTSVYNQALCGFFLLLAFYCLLRFAESGDRRWWLAQWAAFLAGFGALETNIGYPLLAAAYTWFSARKYFRRTLPLFGASAAYAAVHFAFAPPPAGGVYALHLDISMAGTLWTYWRMALGPLPPAAVALLSIAALWLVVRVRGAWLGLAWFVVPLAPLLPLRDHIMDYYLAVPAIGIAMLGAWAVALRDWRAKIAAAACVLIYLAGSLPAARAITRWHYQRSQAVANLVLGVEEVHRREPGRTILLAGVSDDLFHAGLADVPFRVMGIPRVYLAPGSEQGIRPVDLGLKYVLPEALARPALETGGAVVYDASGAVLRNVTGRFRAMASALWRETMPRYLNFGDPIFEAYLGPGWAAARDGYRAAGPRARFRIASPADARERLRLTVFEKQRPVLKVCAEGAELPAQEISRAGEGWEIRLIPPPGPAAKTEMELTLESPAGLRLGFAEMR